MTWQAMSARPYLSCSVGSPFVREQGLADIARHIIETHLKPRVLR